MVTYVTDQNHPDDLYMVMWAADLIEDKLTTVHQVIKSNV